jgi:hypothetical protein
MTNENSKFYGFKELWELLQDRQESIIPAGI